MAGTVKGDGQVVSPAKGNATAADALAKLSAEAGNADANKIGMTGFVGGAERILLTTADGIVHVPEGLYHAGVNAYHHPMELVKTLVGSAVLGATLKTILPEAGPVGKIASVGMAIYFGVETVPKYLDAYGAGLNAKTWRQFNESGIKFGDTTSQLGVDVGLGYLGYKFGAGKTGNLLAGERFDGFADAKQNFWNKTTDISKNIIGMDTTIPTASSIGLRANYVLDGDKAVLLDSVKEGSSGMKVGKPDADAEMNATIMLRGKASILKMDRYIARKALGKATALTDENDAFAKKFGASEESYKAVQEFAAQHNLDIAEHDMRSGRVLVKGKTTDFQKAFTISLNNYATEAGIHTGHEGPVSLPKALATHVRAVLGTDERPAVQPSNRVLYKLDENNNLLDKDGNPVPKENTPSASPTGEQPAPSSDAANQEFVKRGGYLATEIAKAQSFPLRTGGEGQSGAFISLSGGIDLADYNKFFPDHGLEQPRPLGIIEVGGAKNSPGTPNGADTENVLDAVQMQSIAPKAQIDMILGNNDDQGLADVFERGIFAKNGEAQKSVISSSWGLAEGKQTPQALNTLSISFRQAAIRGVQIFAGAGDNGAKANSDFFQPEYPASDPNVVGVGGLKTILNSDGTFSYVSTWDEGEHSSTGGGVSKIFKIPWWQIKAGVPKNLDTGKYGRGSSDISTTAAKSTGFPVRVNGENYVIGGTSAGAPFYAGLMLNINAELALSGISPVTPLNPWMYSRANTPVFHDVTTGGNHGYTAGKGWDPVTGLGWVDGQQMLDAMKQSQSFYTGKGSPFASSIFPSMGSNDNSKSNVAPVN